MAAQTETVRGRRFIVVSQTASTDARFELNDLAGGAGRLDVLLRCVSAAFFLSRKIRKDVECTLVLLGQSSPPRAIRFVGSELRYLNPDERSTGALVRNALLRFSATQTGTPKPVARSAGEMRATPGIYCSKRDLAALLDSLPRSTTLIHLKESSRPLEDVLGDCGGSAADFTFVLGSQDDLTDEQERILDSRFPLKASLGPESIHAEHCITVVHNLLDKARKR